MAKKTRRRTQAGRSARGSSRRQRIHDEDSGPRREKILRGSENEGAPPPEASRREEEGDVRTGRVVALRGREVVVAPGGGAAPVVCLLRRSTRVPHQRSTVLAVGDVVRYLAEGAGPHVLTEVEPRRTRLSRARGAGEEQVIAANVDLCVIVASADRPPFKPRLVDRFLVSAKEGGLEPVLVINKSDLVSPSDSAAMVAPYGPLGFPALAVSAETGEGLDALRGVLRGRTSVLSGQSGVGKSSLLNQLVPDLDIRTADVYGARGKGRHTTSSSTLYELPGGGAVIDTPGLRSFAMHAPSLEALHDFFPEIARAAEACRFADCRHRGDEGCAVAAAVERGQVLPDRLESYLALRADIESR
ncbi:MAG: ribosome small subunit-dependent GTPase A [Candidatus Eiseniibacteriota bacterium]